MRETNLTPEQIEEIHDRFPIGTRVNVNLNSGEKFNGTVARFNGEFLWIEPEGEDKDWELCETSELSFNSDKNSCSS